MSWLSIIGKGILSIFGAGSATNGKSIVTEAADIYERRNPGPVKEHEMSVEKTTVEDKSQESARSLSLVTHEDWFNRTVDALNRLPRPVLAGWAIGALFGLVQPPEWMNAPTAAQLIALNIIWTIIGFYFGVRTISQDLPKIIQAIRKING